MTVSVRSCTAEDEPAWEAFVRDCPQATFFHRYGWQRVLQQAFGHRSHFLLAEADGQVVGVLPLAEVRSRLFGNKLASLPFCVYGGIAASSTAAAAALRSAACERARALGVDALELRNLEPSASGWPVKDLYYTFRKPIDADNEVNLKAIPNRQRAMIRKGIQAGLESEEVAGTERLYRVYAESVRNLGTPVFSRRYLDLLWEEFGDDCRVLMIREGGEDVAGVMSFYFRGEVLPYYGGSIARARHIKGCNHFMYWELMRRSAEEGMVSFDFGRSKRDTGPFDFKKHWGFEPQPLPYEYFLVRAESIPDVNPNNPKYRLLVDAWRRLPLPVANLIGPPLARSLG
ncbi:FemAB family XrtA/PEP-CTERM system-associated protein [Kineobactrum salinum]|uniref:FemAB family PEP-CTERM system-associated protein n=1 Tax=Kineobactrum salinum TaxID=2708301 RepID=A0A6C0U2Y0_9GAMM|nr:FemAB family XrtA/PEP-CTERM system-associated protein [Kineobactrum salinum]QIB64725.1 FemAB family PEP-CTERM system-associated protein [Kineobactrum salinum]